MDIYEVLNDLNIEYKEVSHEPVFTIEEAQKIKKNILGCGCKNLFLTDQKRYYVVILPENKKADLKRIKNIIKAKSLSFAKETELQNILNLERGSVTPLGIINDADNLVTILIDTDLENQLLLFHPNTNSKTLSIQYKDLIKFIEFEKHNYIKI